MPTIGDSPNTASLGVWCERGFNAEAVRQTLVNRIRRHLQSSAPCRNRERFAVVRDHAVASLVLVLLLRRRPAAILRRVRAVVVAPIKRVQRRRTFAHVGEERGEIMLPSVAHHDAASAVAWIRRVVRIRTALLRARPALVRHRAALTVAVGDLCDSLAHRAAARCRVAGAHSTQFIAACIATVATAMHAAPVPPVVWWRVADDGQAAVSVADDALATGGLIRHSSELYTGFTSRIVDA
jgi:hypothetical protein